MQIISYKTKKVIAGDDLFQVLLDSLPKELSENSVVAVTSKIVALCEGRVADPAKVTKDQLTEQEAELYLPRETNPFNVLVSIKHGTFIASGGVDESNGNGMYVLWPEDVQKSANEIREFLRSKYNKKNIGVIITDSRLTPLRWGVTGVCLAPSGFKILKDYVGKPDIFGRLMKVEKLNVADTLAAAAVGVMGEGAEQTPIVVISDVPFVEFVDRSPTQEEMGYLATDMTKEVFTPLLTSVDWKKGKGYK